MIHLAVLSSLTSAASFTSKMLLTSLDYSLLKPEYQLMEELSVVEGIPKVHSQFDLTGWMGEVVERRMRVSEDVARWAMLFGKGLYMAEEFFKYITTEFGYVSLVKDLVDYGGPDHLIDDYLNHHRLHQFPHLPASLNTAIVAFAYDKRIFYPLLSDYPVNHPRIRKNEDLNSTRSPLIGKAMLICYCLGAIELKPFKPQCLTDLVIIDEVSREFPVKMAEFIMQMTLEAQAFLAILQSGGQPPTAEFWNAQVDKHCNVQYNFKAHAPLLCDLIHHLYQHHRDWISGRILDFPPHVRVSYFLSYPSDTNLLALPNPMIPIKFMIWATNEPRLIPYYDKLVEKYSMDALKRAVRLFLMPPILAPGAIEMVKGLIPAIRASTFMKEGNAKSFNQFMTTLYYILSRTREFSIWLDYCLRNSDPTSWSHFRFPPKPQ